MDNSKEHISFRQYRRAALAIGVQCVFKVAMVVTGHNKYNPQTEATRYTPLELPDADVIDINVAKAEAEQPSLSEEEYSTEVM